MGRALAGAFLDTSVADWESVIDVNLWGVIHGCRLFGQQMVEPAGKVEPDQQPGAFDDRAAKAVRAFAELMIRARVSFAILGPEETCTGDPARRAGKARISAEFASWVEEFIDRHEPLLKELARK